MASGNYDEPPFSNGTDYEIWQGKFCTRCRFWSEEYGGPCDEFVIPSMFEDRTPEFLVPDGLSWVCTRFERADG